MQMIDREPQPTVQLSKEALGCSQNEAGVNSFHPSRVPGVIVQETRDLITRAKRVPVLPITKNYTRPGTNARALKHLAAIQAAKHFIVSGHR